MTRKQQEALCALLNVDGLWQWLPDDAAIGGGIAAYDPATGRELARVRREGNGIRMARRGEDGRMSPQKTIGRASGRGWIQVAAAIIKEAL